MPEFVPPRGMRDLSIDESEKFSVVLSRIEPVIRSFGFRRVEPTAVEHLETLQAKSGDAVLNEVYYFKDKGGRELGLRFDLTVGIARMVANDFELPEPIKVYAVAPVWRYDEPQAGRYRCHWQWDIECFGPSEVYADAEIIACALSIVRAAGLPSVVAKISHRGLVGAILQELGVEPGEQTLRVLRALDKSSKILRGELLDLLGQAGLNEEVVKRTLALSEIKGDYEAAKNSLREFGSEQTKSALAELGTIWDALGPLGVRNSCIIDLGVVRGLDYYDGAVFEGFDEALGLSIFGGGRYNALTSIYGKRALPATGVAGGMERLILALERHKSLSLGSNTKRVFVAIAGEEVRKQAIELATELRARGIVTEFPLKRWPLRRQLEYANASGFTYVVVVGKREVESGLFTLKELKSGNQSQRSRDELVSALLPP